MAVRLSRTLGMYWLFISAQVQIRGFRASQILYKKKDENGTWNNLFSHEYAHLMFQAPPQIQRTPLLKFDARNYDEVYSSFKFEVPEYYNIGHEICDKFFPKHEYLKW
jgi:hypothetical protein